MFEDYIFRILFLDQILYFIYFYSNVLTNMGLLIYIIFIK